MRADPCCRVTGQLADAIGDFGCLVFLFWRHLRDHELSSYLLQCPIYPVTSQMADALRSNVKLLAHDAFRLRAPTDSSLQSPAIAGDCNVLVVFIILPYGSMYMVGIFSLLWRNEFW